MSSTESTTTLPTRTIAEAARALDPDRRLQKMERPNRNSRTHKAGLMIPVGRVESYMDKQRICKKRSPYAAVTASAILEEIALRLTRAASQHALQSKPPRRKVKRSDLQAAIQKDPDLAQLFGSVILPGCPNLSVQDPVPLKVGWQARRRARRRARRLETLY